MEIDLIWKSDESIFNYETDLSPFATARAFAKEPWNSQFFDDLKRAHQMHYEQMGRIDGEIRFLSEPESDENGYGYRSRATIDEICISMPSFRDHSHGM